MNEIPGSAINQLRYDPVEYGLAPGIIGNPRPLVYLACPYSHPSKDVEQWRYEESTKAAAWLINEKALNIFSPITHSHPLRMLGGCSGNWKFWEKIDREYIDVSHRLIVLLLDGWKGSVGVQAEIEIASKKGLKIDYLLPLGAGKYEFVNGPYACVPFDMPLSTEPPTCCAPVDPRTPTQVPDGMTNPKDLLGLTKAPLRLVPPALMLFVSKVMELGARKYGPYNWRQKSVRYTVYLEAALRHILAALDGEESDKESKQDHTAHVAACMGIILDSKAIGKLIDDRATPGAAAKIIAGMTEKKQESSEEALERLFREANQQTKA